MGALFIRDNIGIGFPEIPQGTLHESFPDQFIGFTERTTLKFRIIRLPFL